MDAMSNIRALFERAQKLDMPGLAITDHGSISGVPDFLYIAEDFPTVKPIAGCEFWLGNPERDRTYHLILLAKNRTGYDNLVKLTNLANSEGVYPDDARPHIGAAMLAEHHEGLICTSACIGGEIPQHIIAGDMEGAKEAALWYRSIFGENFYLEVSLHKNFGRLKLSQSDNREAYKRQNRELVRLQQRSNEGIFAISQELGIKVVATNDVHFVNREDGIAHDVMLAMQQGRRVANPHRRRYSHLEYLKDEKEMRRLFPGHPEVIDNTLEVLGKVERFSIRGEPSLPRLSGQPGDDLRRMAVEGAKVRYGNPSEDVREHLDYELSVIARHPGAAEYLLMMKRIVECAREEGIAVGPGRNTSAGSLVNYCLGITDVDPIRHRLLFERFLSPDSSELPNIGLDVEWGKEPALIRRLKAEFGEDSVGLISTFPRYSPSTIHKRVARALGLKLGDDETLSVISGLWDVICGMGTHVCGVAIAGGPLRDYVPVMKDGKGDLVSLYDSADLKAAGAIKVDILGLRDISIIKHSVSLIRERHGLDIDTGGIPLDDPETLALYSEGDTAGVFQFQSDELRRWLRDLWQPSFDDLVTLNALYRPGLMNSIPLFILRQSGFAKVKYADPGAEEFLSDTYGIPVFQEQMMCLARKYAGMPEEDARRVYRSIAREKVYKLFIEGGRWKGHPVTVLEQIWKSYLDLGLATFPKAHSVCYVRISFQAAWLKAHYPAEFYRSALNSYIDCKDELERLIPDCEAHGFKVILPDNAESGLFEVEK